MACFLIFAFNGLLYFFLSFLISSAKFLLLVKKEKAFAFSLDSVYFLSELSYHQMELNSSGVIAFIWLFVKSFVFLVTM